MKLTHDMILECTRNKQKPFHGWRRWLVSFLLALAFAGLLIAIMIYGG